MTIDRPIAKYEAGRLWIDQGFTDYLPCDRFAVWITMQVLASTARVFPMDVLTQNQWTECRQALSQYDAAQGEKEKT